MRKRTRFAEAAAGILLLAAGLLASGDNANRNFLIGGLSVRPGEAVSGILAVPGKAGEETAIPLTVIHGKSPGKVLSLVAGVHGYEYPPILALYRLKTAVDPAALSGTLLLVHIANLPSFQRRTIYYTPFDWKNLNRVFPGDPQGTASQRIAHVLNREVIGKSDATIDLHCGDGNEALIPYTYWMVGPDERTNKVSREMAMAFGIPTIVIDETRGRDPLASKYFGNTAILQSKPAITTESGYLGRTDEEAVARNLKGCLSVMRYLEMIPGEPESVDRPVWIDKYEVVNSRFDGLFYPLAEMGSYLAEGQKVGVVTDYSGNLKDELRAPFSGILLYIINTPPANMGEPLFEVGRIKK